MSTVLYLDPVGGLAGDMFLAAAVDLGVPLESLTRALRGLDLPGWRLSAKKAERHAIVGTHVTVHVEGEHEHEAAHAHPDEQGPAQGHTHGHAHAQHPAPDPAHAHPPHRPLSQIVALIDRCATFSPSVKERARRVFQLLGEAEAKIHDVPVETIAFHEVGAVDSIVDICGAAVALELLGNPTVYCAPPPLGSGTTRGAHGVIPVPAPATLELLRGFPVRFEGQGELVTPTGAALLRAFARVGAPPELTVTRVGYGVGTRDSADRPNVLRAVLGEPAHAFDAGTLVLEANLDDATPQLLGALLEDLLTKGALDAYVVPATMKKSRPGHLLSVVAPADKRDLLVDLLLRESTTLGVRFYRTERIALDRRLVEVTTRFGTVHVKLGLRGAEVLNVAPEFDDCRARAREHGVAIKTVWAEALAQAHAMR